MSDPLTSYLTPAADPVHVPHLLASAFGISTSEGRRALACGAVRLGGAVLRDLDVPRDEMVGMVLQYGKRRSVNVVGTESLRPPGPVNPARYTATITTYDGWWFRYRVDRLIGTGIPERSLSSHRTLKGAQRAARRWTAKNDRKEPQIVERYE